MSHTDRGGHRAASAAKEVTMEFLVESGIRVADGVPESEVGERDAAEASAAARLADEGHLVRLWKVSGAGGAGKAVGLYRADNETELEGLLDALPLHDWMQVAVTPLDPHPNDPAASADPGGRAS